LSHAPNVGATWSSSQTAAFGNTDGSGWAGSKLETGNGLHACLDASALWHTAVARAANASPTAEEDVLLQAVSGEIKETIAMTGRTRQPTTIPPPLQFMAPAMMARRPSPGQAPPKAPGTRLHPQPAPLRQSQRGYQPTPGGRTVPGADRPRRTGELASAARCTVAPSLPQQTHKEGRLRRIVDRANVA
jgi:hypothetical protein